MIDTALDLAQRNFGFQEQKIGVGGMNAIHCHQSQDDHEDRSQVDQGCGAVSETSNDQSKFSAHPSLPSRCGLQVPPKEKSSNAVTLSAFVQTPTAPGPVIWPSSSSMYGLPSNKTLMCFAVNSTRNVCHCLEATGASTYLIVIRRPPSVW